MALPTAATGILSGLLTTVLIIGIIEICALIYLKIKGLNSNANKGLVHVAAVAIGALYLFFVVLR